MQCSKCKVNDRKDKSPWCNPCFKQYQKEYRNSEGGKLVRETHRKSEANKVYDNLYKKTWKKEAYVYRITNSKDNKVYFGHATSATRWSTHKYTSKLITSPSYNSSLYTAIRAYGVESFTFEKLFYCNSKEEANLLEIALIQDTWNRNLETYNVNLY